MTLALAGLIAGFLHVLSGPDHLAAMAPYAVEGQRRAWRTGVRWGLGHTAGVLGVGLLALMFRDALHVEALSAWAERCVGFVLIGVGIWGMRAALAARRNRDDRPLMRNRATMYMPLSRLGRFTDWPAVLMCSGSCRHSFCPRHSQRQSIYSCSARAASRRWERSRRSSVGSRAAGVRADCSHLAHCLGCAQRSPSPSEASGSCGVRDLCAALPRSLMMSSTSSCSVPDRRACSPHCVRRSWAHARHL